MKSILVPVSVGELADKLSILHIKSERIDDAGKRAHIQVEMDVLRPIWDRVVAGNPELAGEYLRLKAVNELMWDVQDGLREREARQTFDDAFVRLARAVAQRNGERVAIKNGINRLSGSALVEEKQYKGGA
ncbi:DUF6165 family protein [Pseudofulvimonas gallinarii]|uniref:Uncharacterized protein n=1 Tax=Pseudofulvimonas gallinarii TaxID=634155 RepID=A0A4S3L0Z8_9GAMM|nr:DUF6165 family protein [Pseudofulvimonas gallinarii]TCS96198.1 hypothetical protein EDC25_11652 [Pseudofulvimonas gallinarii]THD14628.1 hypothetical protein B1808_02925 [Pseudofulvimonas gallinarii]